MTIFGLTIVRTKALQQQLQSVDSSRGGWWPLVREWYAGSWQQNDPITLTDALSHPTAWSCVTLIGQDVAKNAVNLVQPTRDDIWLTVENPAYSPVLRKANPWQTRIQFFENWMISKLTQGNTYVLKARDNRNVVTAMYVLDPARVRPLVAPDGSVYYELKRDDLCRLPEDMVIVPASEIIHDRWNCLYHPLVGLSPIYAAGLATQQGLRIQTNSANLFANGSRPGGVLTAPGPISKETAARLKDYWETAFTGDNVGKIAVLGDSLKYEPMTLTAVDTDLIKQLNWSDEKICATFKVPPYLVNVGPAPTLNNIEALARQYHSRCLQFHFESIELLLDEGLNLLPQYGSEFDLDNLLRMDTATMVKTIREGVIGGVMKPNEGRAKLNLPPVEGGDTPYLQQQNFALSALARRDAKPDPFAKETPAPSKPVRPTAADQEEKLIADWERKALDYGIRAA